MALPHVQTIHRAADRVFRLAPGMGMGAAGAERAGGGLGRQDRRLALDHLQPVLARAGDRRDRLQQGAGIRVLRIGEKLFHRGVFHHLPTIHHHHTVGDARNHAQIMGDPNDRHAKFLLQILHQLNNLCLNGHIQRRGGLIGDQQVGLTGQGNGDHHPLAHPAGKLVGIVFHPFGGIRNADQFQQLN